MRILDFSIDYEKHPLGVEESPLFCWKIDEPQTAYANAFNTGIDLITIAPGESSTTNMLIGVVR